MRMLTVEEYKAATKLLEKKCFVLWDIENEYGIKRNIAQTGFHINLSSSHYISHDDEIIIFENLSYRKHVDEYQKAYNNDKTLFHKGNALSILQKMYEYSSMMDWNKSFEEYKEAVCSESCSYILHKKKEGYDDRILRIDTYREIKENDFIGGLFHAINHFTIDKNDINNRNYIYDITYLRYLSAYAFFLENASNGDVSTNNNTITRTIKNPKHNSLIRFVFFTEKESNISFIKTIMPLRR